MNLNLIVIWKEKEIRWEARLRIKNYLEESMEEKVDAIKKGYVHSGRKIKCTDTRRESVPTQQHSKKLSGVSVDHKSIMNEQKHAAEGKAVRQMVNTEEK